MQQGGCDFEYTKHWGAGRHPSLKEAFPFRMFTSPKNFQKHHDGFGEARNTFSDAGYMQFRDGETCCSSAFSSSVGESCQSIWRPRWILMKSPGESLGIFICFAIFITPHWSKHSVTLSEKKSGNSNNQMLFNGTVHPFTQPSSWDRHPSHHMGLSTAV